MSTVLENRPPTRAVLGFATLLDEKGRPMHKSSGNMIEFNEAADRAGADVMRWVYARQRYDDNLLFGWNYLDEVRRILFIPLWNVYSFFVSYANTDRWQPEQGAAPQSALTQLDRWILARQGQLVAQVREALVAYDSRTAAMAVERFVDDLSNWYVRRSRRRFWRSGADADKQAAYATLYEVLTTLCRVLAPFAPFIAEAMWQNLAHCLTVEQASPGAVSVHHQPYPEARPLTAAEQDLLRDVAAARTMVNLGHSTRAQSGLKVRQPLARAMVVADAQSRAAIEAQADLIADELNVKRIEFVARESDLVTYRVLPDSRKLGPRHGALFPHIRKALAEQDPSRVAAAVQAGQPITLAAGGREVELAPGDVLVQAQPREGLVVAGEAGIVVAMDTALTPELVNEGLAREVVRRLNELRKTADLKLTDRIKTTYQASPRLADAIASFADTIRAETLSVELRAEGATGGQTASDTFDGESLTISVTRVDHVGE
jgi:isoleucyl-tRNA synthetase